jgi:ABC-type transporter Mla subunit MlaD
VREQIVEIVHQQYAAVGVDDGELERLRTEQAELGGQIEFVIDSLGSVGKDAARNKIQQLEAKLSSVNGRIAAAAPRHAPSTEQIEATADAAADRLSDLASNLGSMSMHALRELIGSVVAKLEVDLETQAVELELALPAWALAVEESAEARMGLGGNFLRTSSVEAQSASWPRLAAFDCVVARTKCYRCQRRAA